jgi:hypothetical protein
MNPPQGLVCDELDSDGSVMLSGLLWTGIAVTLAVAGSVSCYGGYHRWHARGRFTADRLYHSGRVEFALRAVTLCLGFLIGLALLLGVSK